MGLDIKAYERVVLVRAEAEGKLDHETREREGLVHLYAGAACFEPNFGMTPGYYRTEGREECFCMGPYSSYGRWRAMLAGVLGTTPERVWDGVELGYAPPRAFFHLIHFSDCEGTLGTAACAQLHRDFVENAPLIARSHWIDENKEWFMERYARMAEGLSIAAEAGVLRFH